MRPISRRGVTAGVAAAGAAAIAAGLLRFFHPFARHYAPTPYDDVLAQLTDRAAGARIGQAVLAAMPGFDVKQAAAKVRVALRSRGIAAATLEDARLGHLQDAAGWIMPQTLALLCAVAAGAQSGKV